jgi:hypothetical protein
MPALNDFSESLGLVAVKTSDTTLQPGFAKRRLWQAPEVTTHAAIVLTPARLYLVPGSTPPPAESMRAVESGADPSDAFGSLVTVVNLSTVKSVIHDLLTNTVHLEISAGTGTTGLWTSRATVGFSSAEAADALFTKLWRRLGDEFKLRPDRLPPQQAVQAPLAVLTAILFATAFLVWGSNAAADMGPAAVWWLQPLVRLDWRICAVAGGIAAAIVQLWLYRRLTQPPVRLELLKLKSPS